MQRRVWLGRVAAVATVVLLLAASPAAAATPGAKLWAARYASPGSDESATSTVATPDGTMAFVAGYIDGPSGEGKNFLTIAYSSSTGAALWVATYNSTANGYDVARSVAVSRDGTKVFVAGRTSLGMATIAYAASTGAQLWVSNFSGGFEPTGGVVVSPDGSKVFTAGTTVATGTGTSEDYVTVAYAASTGAQLWLKTWNPAANKSDSITAIGVTPDGAHVIVTGYNQTYLRGEEWVTFAYSATTGDRLWFTRTNAVDGNGFDAPSELAISPNGSYFVVTGSGTDSTGQTGIFTVAFNTITGAQLWAMLTDDPGSSGCCLLQRYGHDVVVSPDGSKVFVTGTKLVQGLVGLRSDYETLAYNPQTGAVLWDQSLDGRAQDWDNAIGIGLSDDGSTVVVSGTSVGDTGSNAVLKNDFATVAYDSATGGQLWLRRHNPAYFSDDEALDLAIVPGQARVVVVGTSDVNGNRDPSTVMIAL